MHAASSMSQKHLLRFMKKKMKKNASDIVGIDRSCDKKISLGEVDLIYVFILAYLIFIIRIIRS